jgi:hypothetical protein
LAIAIHQRAAPIIVSANVLHNFLARRIRQTLFPENNTFPANIVRTAFTTALQSINTLAHNNQPLNQAWGTIHQELSIGTLTEMSIQHNPGVIANNLKEELAHRNSDFLETPECQNNAYCLISFDQNWHIFKHNTGDLYLLCPQSLVTQALPGFNQNNFHEIPMRDLFHLLHQAPGACAWDIRTLTSFFRSCLRSVAPLFAWARFWTSGNIKSSLQSKPYHDCRPHVR